MYRVIQNTYARNPVLEILNLIDGLHKNKNINHKVLIKLTKL